MSRWEPDARGRLATAALELFAEQGFAETTVPQITARAGLTTRTFFRHFADKRAVLFDGEDKFPGFIGQLLAGAPAGLDAMELLEWCLDPVATQAFDGQYRYLRDRALVIEADEGLRERELRKREALTDAIHQGYLARGFDELTASIAAHISGAVFTVSIARWLAGEERPMSGVLHDTFASMRALVR